MQIGKSVSNQIFCLMHSSANSSSLVTIVFHKHIAIGLIAEDPHSISNRMCFLHIGSNERCKDSKPEFRNGSPGNFHRRNLGNLIFDDRFQEERNGKSDVFLKQCVFAKKILKQKDE